MTQSLVVEGTSLTARVVTKRKKLRCGILALLEPLTSINSEINDDNSTKKELEESSHHHCDLDNIDSDFVYAFFSTMNNCQHSHMANNKTEDSRSNNTGDFDQESNKLDQICEDGTIITLTPRSKVCLFTSKKSVNYSSLMGFTHLDTALKLHISSLGRSGIHNNNFITASVSDSNSKLSHEFGVGEDEMKEVLGVEHYALIKDLNLFGIKDGASNVVVTRVKRIEKCRLAPNLRIATNIDENRNTTRDCIATLSLSNPANSISSIPSKTNDNIIQRQDIDVEKTFSSSKIQHFCPHFRSHLVRSLCAFDDIIWMKCPTGNRKCKYRHHFIDETSEWEAILKARGRKKSTAIREHDPDNPYNSYNNIDKDKSSTPATDNVDSRPNIQNNTTVAKKKHRAELFAKWIIQEYGAHLKPEESIIIDVAGGAYGDLARELREKYGFLYVYSVDPRGYKSKKKKLTSKIASSNFLKEEDINEFEEEQSNNKRANASNNNAARTDLDKAAAVNVEGGYKYHLPVYFDDVLFEEDNNVKERKEDSTSSREKNEVKNVEFCNLENSTGNKNSKSVEARELIEKSSLIIGMHPDQATEYIVKHAQRLNKSMAIIPCCVFSSVFLGRDLRASDHKEDEESTLLCHKVEEAKNHNQVVFDQSSSGNVFSNSSNKNNNVSSEADKDTSVRNKSNIVKIRSLFQSNDYLSFVRYLQGNYNNIRTEHLPFQGKNKILYTNLFK